MGRLQSRIDELQRDLVILSNAETIARARVAGEDAEWENQKDNILDKMFGLIVAFKIEDPPHKAVNILGQLMADAERLRSPKRIVVEIDNKRKMLVTLREQLRKYEAASSAAQAAYDSHEEQRSSQPSWMAGS